MASGPELSAQQRGNNELEKVVLFLKAGRAEPNHELECS